MPVPMRSFRSNDSAALLFVGCVIVLQSMVMGSAVLALNAALLISLVFWFVHRDMAERAHVLPAFLAAFLVQTLHFAEEYNAGFQRAFPSRFGYVWGDARFLLFNVAWLLILAACAGAIFRGHRWGYLGAFFLAIGGGIGNGIAHLALAMFTGGYFPGAWTAPLSLAAGAFLLARLVRPAPLPHATHRPGAGHARR